MKQKDWMNNTSSLGLRAFSRSGKELLVDASRATNWDGQEGCCCSWIGEGRVGERERGGSGAVKCQLESKKRIQVKCGSTNFNNKPQITSRTSDQLSTRSNATTIISQPQSTAVNRSQSATTVNDNQSTIYHNNQDKKPQSNTANNKQQQSTAKTLTTNRTEKQQ